MEDSNVLVVLNVVNGSLPVVAEFIRSIQAIAAANGLDATVQVRELEADALRTVSETEKILDGLEAR